MSTAALAHDAFAPRRPPGMRSGLALALGVHVLLILALAWSVNWKTSEPEGVVAELWSALPQIAAPRVAAPEPPRPPVVVEPKPAPPPPAPPAPVAPPREDAQIAIEKARVEAAKKAEAAKREEARRAEAQHEKELAKEREKERDKERERQRLAEEQAEKKKLAEKARQDEAKQAAIHEANVKKMMAQAGASTDPSATGTAARTSGPSASYAGRIKAYLRPFIRTPGSLPGEFRAEVEVRLSPDGSILSTRLTRPSGSSLWDTTVLRALENARSLPRDTDGRVYSPMVLVFNSND